MRGAAFGQCRRTHGMAVVAIAAGGSCELDNVKKLVIFSLFIPFVTNCEFFFYHTRQRNHLYLFVLSIKALRMVFS